MEDIVNFSGRWKLQFIGYFQYLSGYLERSILLWYELGCKVAWESKVGSF
jgi:hypothetical protein